MHSFFILTLVQRRWQSWKGWKGRVRKVGEQPRHWQGWRRWRGQPRQTSCRGSSKSTDKRREAPTFIGRHRHIKPSRGRPTTALLCPDLRPSVPQALRATESDKIRAESNPCLSLCLVCLAQVSQEDCLEIKLDCLRKKLVVVDS